LNKKKVGRTAVLFRSRFGVQWYPESVHLSGFGHRRTLKRPELCTAL